MRKPICNSNEKGFTLIEILVAIAIIGVAFGVIASTTNSVQKRARDSKRVTDLRTIQGYLEQYHSDKQFYPSAAGSGATAWNANNVLVPKYTQALPVDPTNGTTTPYQLVPSPASCTTDCSQYCLYAKLEYSPSNAGPCSSSLPVGYNFSVASP